MRRFSRAVRVLLLALSLCTLASAPALANYVDPQGQTKSEKEAPAPTATMNPWYWVWIFAYIP